MARLERLLRRAWLWVGLALLCVVLAALWYYPPLWPAQPPLSPQPFFEYQGELININTATAAELQALPGIGEAKAKAILSHRQAQGPFTAPEELLEVPGIGEKTLAGFKDMICFG